MSVEFDQDLFSIRAALDQSREELLPVLRSLTDADLAKERRGGWPVWRVLEHVIQSEHIYARLIVHLRGEKATEEPLPPAPATAGDALSAEAAARRALVDALDGVDEETFYTIGKIGHEEYSVLSILENEVNHEREHADQIKAIVASS